jgi:phosphoserine aminotransferase
MTQKIYNFSAGPGAIPEEVLQEAHKELLDYGSRGLSILEISHRSKEFEEIYSRVRQMVRELLTVPDHFEILLLQGGASLQFYMAPLNLGITAKTVDVLHTGHWSGKAIVEIGKLGSYRIAASSEGDRFKRIPKVERKDFNPNAPYVYMTSNNTIYGTQWHRFPDTGGVPIIADMTSDVFSRLLDFSQFGAVFASAQKNLGIAGVTLVIVRKDLTERCPRNAASMLQYRTHINRNTVYNTAPTFSIYMMDLVLKWYRKEGGIPVLQVRNREKARRLYEAIDCHSLYTGVAETSDRSLMNATFSINGGDAIKEKQFVEQAHKRGFIGVKGHSEAGGIRISLYNAVTLEAVDAVVEFMSDFACS